jgi:peptidoglycan/xylan/chitin deacetylase (PgdA/CDA1 family)
MDRQRIKKISYQLSRPILLKYLVQLSGQKFIFPFYHTVSDNPSPFVKHLYPVLNEKQFRVDLDFFLKHFYPANFDEVLEFSQNNKLKRNPLFFITFDDGFKECSEIIAPILKEKNVPAAFFVNPAFIGNKELSHRQKISLIIEKVLNSKNQKLIGGIENITGKSFKSKEDFIQFVKKLTLTNLELIDRIAAKFEIDFVEELKKYQPYLDIPDLLQLQKDGFIIGSHGFEHPEFQQLSFEKMKNQVENSFRFLETNLNLKHRIFSFPFHDIGIPRAFFDYLQNETNVKISFGTSGIKHDEAPAHIHRIPMEMPEISEAETIIRSEYFYYLGKSLFGKNLVKRR